jgi:hypothetical protein
MGEDRRSFIFRKRNFLGAVLLAGIGLGVYLGKLNFGLGGGNQFGLGSSGGETQVSIGSADRIASPIEPAKEKEELPIEVPDVVRILIDDRQYYLRSETGSVTEAPIALPKLVQLIELAPGDEDGLRVRVYRKATARASAEEKLKTALTEAGIHDAAVFWVPNPVK